MLVLLIVFQLCNTFLALVFKDFYDVQNATELKEQHHILKHDVKYPHWADESNSEIVIVNSGVIRLSGLSAKNSLDILVFATLIPLHGSITYKVTSEQKLVKSITDLITDLGSEFNASEVTFVTWRNVEFNKDLLSSFQVALATDGNKTFAVLNILEINHVERLQYFPEIDLRYSYDDGEKVMRSGFLNDTTGIASGSANAGKTAASESNSGLKGRWVLDLSKSPIVKFNDSSTPPIVYSVDKEKVTAAEDKNPITNSSGMTWTGIFHLKELSLNEVDLLSGKDEMEAMLEMKDQNATYREMDAEILNWLKSVYGGIRMVVKPDIQVTLYSMGSLIVEYVVSTATNACEKKAAECLEDIKKAVVVKADDGVDTEKMSMKVNPLKTSLSSYGVCNGTSGIVCDVNAYCVSYPDVMKYGCICKSGFEGDGFPGNCIEVEALDITSLALGGIAGAWSIVVIVVVLRLLLKREIRRKKELESALIKRKIISKKRKLKRKSFKSTKLRHRAENAERFDIYHGNDALD